MRILYLCHRIPFPPNKGDKIRAFHQVRAMAARHEVDLFTLADDPADLEQQSGLREYCNRITVARLNPLWARISSLPYLLTRTPLTIPYFDSAELRRQVRQALMGGGYDRVFVYCSAMAQYVEQTGGIPVITDFVDVDSDKWTQYATFTKFPFSAIYRREGNALRAYEQRICRNSSCVVVTTEREARLVREMDASARVHVIANGVDTDYFRPSDTVPEIPTVGFTGDMSYFPNQEAVISFANQVLPLIRKSIPETRFLIVGRNPNRDVQQLAGIKGVEVTGMVPDIRPYLARMGVSVAPFSIAAGIQNKILEAMSCELPVVATPRAVQGFSVETGAAIEIAEGPEAMAAQVVRLLRNPSAARQKGIAGRRLVLEEFSWSRGLDRLLQLVENPALTAFSGIAATPSC